MTQTKITEEELLPPVIMSRETSTFKQLIIESDQKFLKATNHN